MKASVHALVLGLSLAVAAHAADPKAAPVAGPKPAPAPAAPESTASATASPSSFADHKGFELLAGAGLNLLQYPTNTANIDNRMSLMGYATADYFFTSNLGVFTGAHLLSRGFKQTLDGTSANATYVDIPFGLAIGLPWSSGSARTLIRLGGYYAVATASDFTGGWDMTTGFGNSKTKGFAGLYVDHATVFRMADHFGIGYTVWGKIPMGGAHESLYSHKFYEAGIGFVLAYE